LHEKTIFGGGRRDAKLKQKKSTICLHDVLLLDVLAKNFLRRGRKCSNY
jgi:hypothetical protein